MDTPRHNPLISFAALPEVITRTLATRSQAWSVRELHRTLLEDYDVDFGAVVAIVLRMIAYGQLQTQLAPPPRSSEGKGEW